MPPKPLPEKSYVILKNHKYFEALTSIVMIQSQEDQQSLMMTLKLNGSGYFRVHLHGFQHSLSTVQQYTIGLH